MPPLETSLRVNRKFKNLGVGWLLPRCYSAESHGCKHQPFQSSDIAGLVPLLLCHYHHHLILSHSLALLYSCTYPQHSLDRSVNNRIAWAVAFLGVDRKVSTCPRSSLYPVRLIPPATLPHFHSMRVCSYYHVKQCTFLPSVSAQRM